MIGLLKAKRHELVELCRQYHVARLEVFGSAATGEFDPDRSDLDLLVTFGQVPSGERAHCFFGLQFALEDLFGRQVDLVEVEALRNPYFIADINRSRELLHAA